MNFQSIFFVLSIFAQFAFGYSKISTGGKLSPEENQKRLDTCGRGGLANPHNPSKPPPWFWVSYHRRAGKQEYFTSASQLSSRHFLTFPTNLLTKQKKWIHTKLPFDVNCTDKNNLHVEIPTSVLKQFNLTTLGCYRGNKCSTPGLTPVKAFLPYYCNSGIQEKMFAFLYSPMIVEVREEIPAVPVCIDHQVASVHNGDTVESYRLYDNKQSEQSKLNVQYVGSGVIATSRVESAHDFNGPIVKSFADKWTIVGYTSIYGISENNAHQLFYRMSWFQDAICSLTGICYGEPTKTTIPVPTIPPIKTTVPVTTAKLTTANKPAAIVTRITPTPMPRPVTNTFTPVQTSVPMTTGRPTIPTRPATSNAIASTKGPITIAAVQKTLPPTTVHLTTVTTTPTTVATVKAAITKPPEAITTVTSTKTSPPVKTTVATAKLAPITVTTVPTIVRPVSTEPPEALTTVTSTTSSNKPPPVSMTVATVAAPTFGETTSQVTTTTTLAIIAGPDSMTVPTILSQNSTDKTTPDSSVDSSAPTNQTTNPEDPPPDDPVTYEPPLALGIDFSLGPEHSIDEPPIDYEEYEERKKHMDDDDQDYKDFWMDENGNGGEKGMRLELFLIFVVHFMRLQ
ncbi:hypothetical protein CAEBREN_05656 [Caenorhabditis brenneri]|uniref:Uncharacterized protein n=1 Tax=Caenorhabditis brenneri TaxID=135651 RepID=G0MJ33_CAEBE|nr:hypothetical protein CAEBREN_05656 [Caenorhabditis brenneri]